MSVFASRLYKSEGVTPEITAVYEYISSLVGPDCAGDKELTFLVLRVRSQLCICSVFVFVFHGNI